MNVERIELEKYAFRYHDYLYIVFVEDEVVTVTANVIYETETIVAGIELYSVAPLHYITINGNRIAYKEYDRYVVYNASAYETAVKIHQQLNFNACRDNE